MASIRKQAAGTEILLNFLNFLKLTEEGLIKP